MGFSTTSSSTSRKISADRSSATRVSAAKEPAPKSPPRHRYLHRFTVSASWPLDFHHRSTLGRALLLFVLVAHLQELRTQPLPRIIMARGVGDIRTSGRSSSSEAAIFSRGRAIVQQWCCQNQKHKEEDEEERRQHDALTPAM